MVSDQAYSSDNKISQGPFKLGKWQNSTVQQFEGSIYAVRIYNRALNNDELLNNNSLDIDNYIPRSTDEKILFDYAIANDIVTTGDGLYNTDIDKYIYKGKNSLTNYIRFDDSTTLYRILGFNPDGTAKLMGASLMFKTAFDAEQNRNTTDSTYCTMASSVNSEGSYYGCNFFGPVTNYNGKTVSNNSTVLNVFEGWYQGLPDSIKSKIVEHDFNMGIIRDGSSLDAAREQAQSVKWTGKVGLVELLEVLDAGLTTQNTIKTTMYPNNYMQAMTSTDSMMWLMNGTNTSTYDVWSITFGNGVSKRRASRTEQLNGKITAYTYAIPSFYISRDVTVTGSGLALDPYVIKN